MHSFLNKEPRKTASDLSSTDHVSVVKVGVEIKLRIVRARLISVCHACHRTEQHSKWNCRL